MIKNKRVAFAIYVIAFVALWKVAEMLWGSLTGGTSSNRAVKHLRAMGYTRVINMGGINKYKGEIERG